MLLLCGRSWPVTRPPCKTLKYGPESRKSGRNKGLTSSPEAHHSWSVLTERVLGGLLLLSLRSPLASFTLLSPHSLSSRLQRLSPHPLYSPSLSAHSLSSSSLPLHSLSSRLIPSARLIPSLTPHSNTLISHTSLPQLNLHHTSYLLFMSHTFWFKPHTLYSYSITPHNLYVDLIPSSRTACPLLISHTLITHRYTLTTMKEKRSKWEIWAAEISIVF